MQIHPARLFSTYSIVARDPHTGQLGVAVQTHQMTVGSVVPWLLPGVGAVATQSLTNISFGPLALAMLREGVPAPRVVDAVIASDNRPDVRQVAVVDAQGEVGAWTGKGCIPEAGHYVGEGYSVQANMMTNDTVIDAMAEAYETSQGDIAQRMMAALEAAQREGGDIRGMQSAVLKVVAGDACKHDWETDYDLRVDEHEDPVMELARLVRFGRAQVIDHQGYDALKAGDRVLALQHWAAARDLAPELEEIAYWQALTLADEHGDMEMALTMLRPMLDVDDRRAHWLDLIQRLQACGLLETDGLAERLIAELG
ncbi:MAG: DUF1028 domain-containing protein [Anaerolineae bacterium]|nr:DUF1028 domain-containing protein [Anaerolineae bacterium]